MTTYCLDETFEKWNALLVAYLDNLPKTEGSAWTCLVLTYIKEYNNASMQHIDKIKLHESLKS